ncbi:NUP188 [[Candida] subhashii]|uniref:Nucleoporin NUP188 n=1 Tax=[Candida] subhashii TaxID=561895 RepID=A0A8J5UFB6_9ASCO|nr:NUP188 [[Candida] subhashii]KAG7661893.1 NUP188 [[Candida] subhashii]
MTKSLVQLDSDTDRLPLKPIQPTQYWTFDNALTLINSCEDPYILDALDEFLMLNSGTLRSPSPFELSGKKEKLSAKDLTLRSVLYTDVTPVNISDAEIIEQHLHCDAKEVLRIIIQTCKKIPPKFCNEFFALKSKLHDDRDKELDNERLFLYTSKILRERRIILKIAIELLNNKSNSKASLTIQNLGKEIFTSKTYVESMIISIQDNVNFLMHPKTWGLSEKLDELVHNERVLFIIEASKVLTEIIVQNPTLEKSLCKQWFHFMKGNNFAMSLGPRISHPEAFAVLQGLFTIISVAFLDLENAFDNASNAKDGSYFNDANIFVSVNDAITNPANTNSVILYAWSIVLLRKYYFMMEYPESTINADLSNKLNTEQINSIVTMLNQKCAELNVFHAIRRLNELLKFDRVNSVVLSNVILASMPLIDLTADVARAIESIVSNCPKNVVEKFFENDSTIDAIVLARTKFPLSLTPYIILCSINGGFALHEFNELKSYIQVFKKEEFVNMYQIDDQNTELVKLSQGIDIFPPFESNKKISMALKSGTKAKILPAANQEEVLVTFLHRYNGWALLGRIAQNISKEFNASDPGMVNLIVEVLRLLNRVVLNNNIDDSKKVLDALSAFTDDSDILEVVLRLFEQALHARNVEVLSGIIDLLTNLMPFLSYRIWPYLSKSSIFPHNGKEGFASIIFGSIEMVSGSYDFTVSLVKFVDALIQNCLSLDQDYPQKSKAAILSKFVNHLVSIFETFTYCRFSSVHQKLEMGVLILDIFSTILASVHGVAEDSKPEEKVTKVFAEPSARILDAFLMTDSDCSRACSPILGMIDSLSETLQVYELIDVSGFWYDSWIRCALSYSQLIITIRSSLSYKPSAFERNLYSKLPSLVASYSQFESIRKDILDLLTSLTSANWLDEQQPSLLSNLGRDCAQVLMHSLATDIDNSFDDYKLKISLYDFICGVMGGKQDGLSVLFISGRDVFGDFTKSEHSSRKVETKISLLQILKKNIRDIKYYPNSVSIHLVDALSLACNSWTTAKENENDIEFINTLISRVRLQISDPPDSSDSFISRCYELKLVSKITEILALHLFATRNEECKKNIINFVNSDDFIEIAKTKFAVKNYQASLHANVSISFESLFPTLKLSQFATGLAKRNRFGTNSVYNLALMDALFKNEPGWPQIREQVIATSINLQYVDAQISSAKSFGALLTCFCRKFDGALDERILDFVDYLLKLDICEGIPSEIFQSIYHERVELAFYLIYTFYSRAKSTTKSRVFEIIKSASTLLSSGSMDFISSLAESKGFYRPLLKVVYCSLGLIKKDSSLLTESFSLFRDLFELIICQGTKTLLIELQNDLYAPKSSKVTKVNERIDDLMLILSILKSFVGVSSSTNFQNEMSLLVNKHGTIKSLLNLFSFSHSVEVNGELIFAQLSLMYILELMSVDVIADKFASSGLFVVLLESPISSTLRAGGVSISNGSQYHRLWINGILPIIITSLFKIGPSIIPELSVALQLYSKQIETCIESWSRDSSSIKISTALIAETGQILLLYDLLKAMNAGEYWRSVAPVVSTIEGGGEEAPSILPGLENESKIEDFVDCLDNLLKHPKFLTSRIIPSSLEEQHVIQTGGEPFANFVKGIINEISDLKDFFS